MLLQICSQIPPRVATCCLSMIYCACTSAYIHQELIHFSHIYCVAQSWHVSKIPEVFWEFQRSVCLTSGSGRRRPLLLGILRGLFLTCYSVRSSFSPYGVSKAPCYPNSTALQQKSLFHHYGRPLHKPALSSKNRKKCLNTKKKCSWSVSLLH